MYNKRTGTTTTDKLKKERRERKKGQGMSQHYCSIPHRTTAYNRGRKRREKVIVQELCESRGGRPELSVLTSLLVSVDVKNY